MAKWISWRDAKTMGAIVADEKPAGWLHNDEVLADYGGYLIGESIDAATRERIIRDHNALAPDGPVAHMVHWAARLDYALLHPHGYDAQQSADIIANFRDAVGKVHALLEASDGE